jgi:hypothetical protein
MIGPCCPGKPVARSIRIGGQMVGIAQLDAVIDSAVNLKDAPEEELKAILLAGIQEHNYVPSEMEDEYTEAIWQEFLKRKSMNSSCSCSGCR